MAIRNDKNCAIIPAAGVGLRLGNELPKALVSVAGKPIIEHTVRLFVASRLFEKIVVTAATDLIDRFRALLPFPEVEIVAGGETRQYSVFNALAWLDEHHQIGSKKCAIAIHDAARCLVSPSLVARSLAAAEREPALTAVVPVSDSLIRRLPDGSSHSFDWAGMFAVQTPQVFSGPLIMQAHRAAADTKRSATDDAALVEALHSIFLLEGEVSNIKVTTPVDLMIAEQWLCKQSTEDRT